MLKVLLISFVALVCTSAVSDIHNTAWKQKILSRSSRSAVTPVPALIAANGYTVEIHSVTTRDDYILEIHRIPASPTSPSSFEKPVAFLMHGLLSSSADWIITGPGKGFGYILADAGYDVWMGNARGNTYSKKHKTITDLTGKDFWNFSWHEIGIYDLPAMIDFVLKETKQEKLFYIGHSQGTTSFFVMTSERPEYNSKIKAMFALSPVAYMGNLRSPLMRFTSKFVWSFSHIFRLLGIHEFLPSNDLLRLTGSTFCDNDDIAQILCTNALFVLFGFNRAQLNTTTLPTIFEHVPAGASTRQIIHYGQEIRSRKFRQFDYGWTKNKLKYGSLTPPKYSLGKITAPVHLVYGDNDWAAAVEDVKQLHRELGNPVEMVRVLDEKWNHLDFLWGIDAKRLVYDDILATLKNRYSTS